MGALKVTWDGLKEARAKEGMETHLDARLADFIDSLVDSVESNGVNSASRNISLQGDFTRSVEFPFPSLQDCLSPEGGLKKYYAWRIAATSTLFDNDWSVDDIIVAKKDDADQYYYDWFVIGADEGLLPNLIAEAIDIDTESLSPTSFRFIAGKSLGNYFVTHAILKWKSGDISGFTYSFNIGDAEFPLQDLVPDSKHPVQIPFDRHSFQDANIALYPSSNSGTGTIDILIFGFRYLN